MDERSLDFWRKYNKAPDVLAVMPARIVGKAISSHPNQPVQITVETTLPDGTVLGLPLVFPGEEDAAHIPNTVSTDEKTGERTYAKPLDVFLLVVSRPKQGEVEEAEVEEEETEEELKARLSPPPPPAQQQTPSRPLPPPLKPSNATTSQAATPSTPSTPATPGTSAPPLAATPQSGEPPKESASSQPSSDTTTGTAG